jgi:hypothetical protein
MPFGLSVDRIESDQMSSGAACTSLLLRSSTPLATQLGPTRDKQPCASMAHLLVEGAASLLQPTMDYEGQKLSELLFHIIILAFGGVGWIFGYFAQDFSYVFYAWAAGTAISVVVSFFFRGSSQQRRRASERFGILNFMS